MLVLVTTSTSLWEISPSEPLTHNLYFTLTLIWVLFGYFLRIFIWKRTKLSNHGINTTIQYFLDNCTVLKSVLKLWIFKACGSVEHSDLEMVKTQSFKKICTTWQTKKVSEKTLGTFLKCLARSFLPCNILIYFIIAKYNRKHVNVNGKGPLQVPSPVSCSKQGSHQH